MNLKDSLEIFINPLLYVWIGLLILCFPRKAKRSLLLMVIVYFYIISIPFTSFLLRNSWKIEDTYDPTVTYDAVVVLSGFAELGWYSNNNNNYYLLEHYFRFSPNVERLLNGVKFVKSGHARMLLLGSRSIESVDEAAIAKDFALKQGLAENQIKIYGVVNRTLDEAIGVKAFAAQHGIRRILLVTSEIHMKRALALFRKQGLCPDVYSSHTYKPDFKTGYWRFFNPCNNRAQDVEQCFYEIAGYARYYVTGDL